MNRINSRSELTRTDTAPSGPSRGSRRVRPRHFVLTGGVALAILAGLASPSNATIEHRWRASGSMACVTGGPDYPSWNSAYHGLIATGQTDIVCGIPTGKELVEFHDNNGHLLRDVILRGWSDETCTEYSSSLWIHDFDSHQYCLCDSVDSSCNEFIPQVLPFNTDCDGCNYSGAVNWAVNIQVTRNEGLRQGSNSDFGVRMITARTNE